MGPISLIQFIKISVVIFTERLPSPLIFLYYIRDDLICLSEIVVEMDVFKSVGNASPAINLLLRKLIDIVGYLFMRYKHYVHLQRAASIALLRKILKHLGVTYRCLRNVRLQVFAELVIYNIYARIATVFEAFCNALV